MQLTIIKLERFSHQDYIDLSKIWPEYNLSSLKAGIYAARFNERLLGAVRVTLCDDEGILDSFRIRKITRQRGIGRYLLEEVLADNPGINNWWMTDVGVENRTVMTAFMQTLNFTAYQNGWVKRLTKSAST